VTDGALLESVISRLEDLVQRVQILSQGIGERELNAKPIPKRWSIGQTFEHMILGAQDYVANVRTALANTRREGVEREVSHTWFGRIIIRGAGPTGNAPVPKPLIPEDGPYRKDVVDRWLALHQEIIELAKKSHGYDLSGIPMRSPIIKLFKMNIADVFEILAGHAERHVSQIEALAREQAAAGR
jgi:hypothetical protein